MMTLGPPSAWTLGSVGVFFGDWEAFLVGLGGGGFCPRCQSRQPFGSLKAHELLTLPLAVLDEVVPPPPKNDLWGIARSASISTVGVGFGSGSSEAVFYLMSLISRRPRAPPPLSSLSSCRCASDCVWMASSARQAGHGNRRVEEHAAIRGT